MEEGEGGWQAFPLKKFSSVAWNTSGIFSVQPLYCILALVSFAFTQPDKLQTSILPLLRNIQPDTINLQSFITCQFNHKEELSKVQTSGVEVYRARSLSIIKSSVSLFVLGFFLLYQVWNYSVLFANNTRYLSYYISVADVSVLLTRHKLSRSSELWLMNNIFQ